MRYFLEFAYKGTNYHGWQIQPNAHTVQEEINNALSLILRQKIETTASGRTDKGVHASQQFLHFDFDSKLDDQLVYKLNRFLPHDIPIYRIIEVSNDAHARFDATRREYDYVVSRVKNPFAKNQYYLFDKNEVDLDKMQEACEVLQSFTDFQALSKVNSDVNTFDCTIFEAKWTRTKTGFSFHVAANRFLRGMVRAIVGTMLEIGQGKMTIHEFRQALESKDRRNIGQSAPADGLFLSKIEYPYL